MTMKRSATEPATRSALDASAASGSGKLVRVSWHSLSATDCLLRIGTSSTSGLSDSEVCIRREQFGPNALAEAAVIPLWKKFLRQFGELVIWILIGAAIIAGLMGEMVDTLAILAIVLLNGVIGFLQEEKAERALASLQKMSSPMAKVLRNGRQLLVPAAELVPGDCISVEAGDAVPADARLLSAYSLQVQEAPLTGESVPVEKDPGAILPEAALPADRHNLVFFGTVVAAGRGTAVVISTGMNTELGQIAGLLSRTERELTPLQKRLAELGRVLVSVCLVIVTVIFTLQMLRGGRVLETLLISVSLAVAAVPEGLPAVVTLTLALGLQRMVRRNALVRKLPSVETLGSVTVICSDKTGTLTRNEMTVREIVTTTAEFQVTGAGYVPEGQFLRKHDGQIVDAGDSELRMLLTTAALCNNASLLPAGGSGDRWQVVGDPTEGALIVAAMKARIESPALGAQVLFEIPFDSERKTMSVVVRLPDNTIMMYSKGAPEVLLSRCRHVQLTDRTEPLTDHWRQQILSSGSRLAGQAMRVLALAFRPLQSSDPGAFTETDLVFLGLVGMIDPPREEAREAVKRCLIAGIRPVMITGDHPETALAIARELQIAGTDSRVMSGQQLREMSDEQLVSEVDSVSVYARVSAEHKLRIVRALKARQHIVAMTGDGVNDAPAIKEADIGIAMGVTGTDVTKEASDMILMDDNFASIVNAVEEGRGIFDNIQKFVHFLLACNTSEVLLMFFAALAGWPVPLMAIHILWINLVTDGFPALALGMERPEKDLMNRAPRAAGEGVLNRSRGLLIFTHGMLMAAMAGFAFWHFYGNREENLAAARTATFAVSAFAQLFFAIGCRSQTRTMPELGPLTNPWLSLAILLSAILQFCIMTLPLTLPVFEVQSPPLSAWVLILTLSLFPVTVVELVKIGCTWVRQWQLPENLNS